MFAFGDAPYLRVTPGLGMSVHDIKGIVPTTDNRGYFLVGQDGGVFAFGDAGFLGSLPGAGIHIDDRHWDRSYSVRPGLLGRRRQWHGLPPSGNATNFGLGHRHVISIEVMHGEPLTAEASCGS